MAKIILMTPIHNTQKTLTLQFTELFNVIQIMTLILLIRILGVWECVCVLQKLHFCTHECVIKIITRIMSRWHRPNADSAYVNMIKSQGSNDCRWNQHWTGAWTNKRVKSKITSRTMHTLKFGNCMSDETFNWMKRIMLAFGIENFYENSSQLNCKQMVRMRMHVHSQLDWKQ